MLGASYRPAYTPYADEEVGLRVGLKLLDPTDWMEPDGQAEAQFANKVQQLEERHGDVVQTAEGSEAAQRELLRLVSQYVVRRFPDLYEADGWIIRLKHVGLEVDTVDEKLAPIDRAARLVQEDLCLLQPSPDGFALTAASVCAPSSWVLAEKMGKPLLAIHEPVPGYEEKLAPRVNRIFQNLKVDQPVQRANWSIMTEPTLYLPHQHDRSPQRLVGLIAQTAGERLYIRVERQTLRRLPETGAIVFTIKTHIDPLRVIGDHRDLVAGLGRALNAMSPEMLAYKGITPIEEALKGWVAWRLR